MKFKINSKFNIKNPQSILKHDFYWVQGYRSGKKKKKSIIRFRDIDCLFPTVPAEKPTKTHKKNRHNFYWVQGYISRSSFPHYAGGFELIIGANEDQAKEEEAVEDEEEEEKEEEEEEEAAVELADDDCGFKQRSFTRFVEGFGRICGLKGKNKVKWPLKS